MQQRPTVSLWQIFTVFLRLGITSFGGPVAHLAFFRAECVQHRRWLTEQQYAGVVALCQFLPGPASSQTGMAIGYLLRGYRGALLSWLGFTLPSALLMACLAMLGAAINTERIIPAISGLKLFVLAIVAQAAWQMSLQLCAGTRRKVIMLFCLMALLLMPTLQGQLLAMSFGAIAGLLWLPSSVNACVADDMTRVNRAAMRHSVMLFGVFVLLLVILPWLVNSSGNVYLQLFDALYRSGALVFGGGHVVLPLLQAELASSGLISDPLFMAGYGAVQAMPGPLFTFASFIGASSLQPAIYGALLATFAIFLPGMLLVLAALPWWQKLQHSAYLQRAMAGVNAAVVAMLLALIVTAMPAISEQGLSQWMLVMLFLIGLMYFRLPAYVLVAMTIVGGVACSFFN